MSKKLEIFSVNKANDSEFAQKNFYCIIRIQNLWMLEVQVFFNPFWSNVVTRA